MLPGVNLDMFEDPNIHWKWNYTYNNACWHGVALEQYVDCIYH